MDTPARLCLFFVWKRGGGGKKKTQAISYSRRVGSGGCVFFE